VAAVWKFPAAHSHATPAVPTAANPAAQVEHITAGVAVGAQVKHPALQGFYSWLEES